MGLRFDRTVSDALLVELLPGGRFAGLVRRRTMLPLVADVQLRRNRGPGCHASLYIGLTKALDVIERHGQFKLDAHKTHRAVAGFDASWTSLRSADAVAADWDEVERYLDRLLAGRIAPRWYQKEGVVHAALCSGRSAAYGAVQREAVVWAEGGPFVRELVSEHADRLWAAVGSEARQEPWWPGLRDPAHRAGMGDEVDILCVDPEGRLLCIEAKPASAIDTMPWAAAQVLVYADLFARWVDESPDVADAALRSMSTQRARLGLVAARWADVPAVDRVVPVVAIGAGRRGAQALHRLADVAAALGSAPRHERLDRLEVWLLDTEGHPTDVWFPGTGPVPSGRGTPVSLVLLQGFEESRAPEPVEASDDPDAVDEVVLTDLVPAPAPAFRKTAHAAAVAWKLATSTLNEAARAAVPIHHGGSLDHLLPAEHRWEGLVPEARDIARTRFEAAGIRWHGDEDGPNNNLLSSQVQCLNALAPLVNRPEALADLLRPVLPVAEVLPFGADTTQSPYDATDHVVFEWQGLADHLDEWGGRAPTRGAMATSVDAAVRYVSTSGSIELALIEWKYTETYPYGGRLNGTAKTHQGRIDRYRPPIEHPDSPIHTDQGVDYEDLLAEPTYQLLRQQLLAWQIEQANELDVQRAVVVYASPAANLELHERSTGGHRFTRLARAEGGLIQAWRRLLRRLDRFATIDTVSLVTDESPCSPSFKDRYAHLGSTVTEPAAVPHGNKSPPPSSDTPTEPTRETPDRLTGDQLMSMDQELDWDATWIGRRGGLTGTDLAKDLRSGAWRTTQYQVRTALAAPSRNWFGYEDFRDAVEEAAASARNEARVAAGWKTIAVVHVESGAAAFARLDQRLPLVYPEPLEGWDGLVGFGTHEDGSYPIEERSVDGHVVEIRLDLVTDVDDVEDGAWEPIGTLTVGSEGAMVACDPYATSDEYRHTIPIPPGRWLGQMFRTPDDTLGLRLIPAD